MHPTSTLTTPGSRKMDIISEGPPSLLAIPEKTDSIFQRMSSQLSFKNLWDKTTHLVYQYGEGVAYANFGWSVYMIGRLLIDVPCGPCSEPGFYSRYVVSTLSAHISGLLASQLPIETRNQLA